MGVTSSRAGDPEGGPSLRIERVGAEHRREALAMLLTGQARAHDPAVDQFLGFSREHGVDLTQVWAARREERMSAAALLAPSPGRSAMLFTSPIQSRDGVASHARLIEHVCEAQRGSGLRLVQSLLDPHQIHERRALTRAQFDALAVLVYMQRGIGGDPPSPRRSEQVGDIALDTLRWSEANRQAFARAIEASYEGTLDCPGLVGVRDIQDVIEGHMATGRFDPKLWYAFYHGDQPVGVMLLNDIPPRRAVELVYVGLSLPWRGKGLGRWMMAQALRAAGRREALSIVLAVDDNNGPALHLYRELAFRPTARKTAMIRVLP